jgi:hypothetical protein
MASLKDINATIEEGNEDLEKLNRNFSKWFESQKKGGDDLEAAAEARTKKGKGGIIKAAATGAAVSKMAEKDGISKYLKYALPLMLPLAWPFFKDYMNKKRFDVNGDGTPDFSLTDGAVVAGLGYGSYKTVSMANRISKSMAAAREVKLNLKNTKAFEQRMKVLELQIKADKLAAAADAERIRQAKIDKMIAQKNKIGSGSKSGNLFGNLKTSGGTVTGLNNARNSSIRIPTAANTTMAPAANTNKIPPPNQRSSNKSIRNSGMFKNFMSSASTAALNTGSRAAKGVADFVKKVPGEIRANLRALPPNPIGFKGNSQKYGQVVMAFLQGITPKPIQKIFGVFLSPKANVLVLSGYTILEIAMILSDHETNYKQAAMFQGPFITPLPRKRTRAEKMSAIINLLGSVTIIVLGSIIGGIIGSAVIPPIGTVSGAIIGGLLAGMVAGDIMQFLFDWANGKLGSGNYAKRLQHMGVTKETKDRLTGMATKTIGSGPTLMHRGDTMPILNSFKTIEQEIAENNKRKATAAMLGNTPDFHTDSFKAMNKKRYNNNGLDYRNVFLGGGDRMSSNTNITPDFVRGISGGGFSTAPDANSIQMLGTAGMQARRDAAARGALMNGPEAGRDNVSSFVDAKSTNVTTVVAGGNGIKTIDTEMARRMHSYQMIGGIVSGQRAY